MTHASHIDVYADDRGLSMCFQVANLLPEWSKELIAKHRWETLEDFVYWFDDVNMEDSLTQVLVTTTLKENRLARSRLKAARAAGLAAIKTAASEQKHVDAPDEILPDSTMQQMSRDFQAKYNLTLDPMLEPSDALRSRCYREFRKRTMTVIPASKIRSILHQSTPRLQEAVRLGSGVQLEFQTEEGRVVKTVVDHYWALRTLAYAWGWAGLFKQQDFDKQERTFMPLDQALAYADHALQSTMEYGHGSLLWLEKCDTLTRSKMASLVRRGYTGGSALAEALRQTHLEWRSPALQPTMLEAASPNAKRKAAEMASAEEKVQPSRRQIKSDKWPTVSQIKGGQRFCKPWNDGRGCQQAKCPNIHKCDVKLPSGKPCSASHTRLQHSE